MALPSPGPLMPLQHSAIASDIPCPPQQDVSQNFSANLFSLFLFSSFSILLAPFYPYRREPALKGYTPIMVLLLQLSPILQNQQYSRLVPTRG
jgi:hypothetical protein